jgi:4-amino-4-deoxy-L-arabinose transferase-like glycosyltransferase
MPFSEMHENPDLDMNFFDAWGDRIAHGDFLTDTVFHPYHNWHKEAADYLGAKSGEEGRKMWSEWYGGKTYHQEPLYAQILGICKMIGGNGHMLMYMLQILSTLFSIWMIIWLGRHYFGPIAGIGAGFLFSLYSPAILFDVFLLRTSLTTCYMLSLLFVAEKLMMGKSKPWIFGMLGGVGYLLQSTAVLLWIPLFIRWFICTATRCK